MSESVELRPLDDHLEVDTETGEIVAEAYELESDDLPKIARQMRALAGQAAIIGKYQSAEILRITDFCDHKAMRLTKQYEYYEQVAQRILEQSGQKKIEYPGLGTLRFRKMPEKVDTSAYDAMSDAEKLHVQNERKGYFNTKTTVTPDKKAIKAQLRLFEAGESEVDIRGFKVIRPPDKFEFVPEGGQ